MTRKEKVMEMQPEMVDEIYGGGVLGCPGYYPYLHVPELVDSNCGCELINPCEDCWNKEFVDDTDKETRNISELSDTFVCEKCGICLEDCVRVEYDEDDGDTYHYEYEFKFCPECGRRVAEE